MPTPDPPPSELRPDPPPEAAAPPAVVTDSAAVLSRAGRAEPAARTSAVEPAASRQQARPTPQAIRPKTKPKRQVAQELPVPRDSAPMPRIPSTAAEVLERGRLALAGIALAVVALGGAVVLGASRRVLAGARA
jgi:hypothetical protein